MKILNLYAGIGGNRELWEGDITAVERDLPIAKVYKQRFPTDNVICGDVSDYIVRSDAFDYDFIWASPPCQTHSQYRYNVGVKAKGYAPVIPDMTGLYGLIVFLQYHFKGLWAVENVKPYYPPLIPPTVIIGRHLFWSNFPIPLASTPCSRIRTKNKISDFPAVELGGIKNKRQALRNCVDAAIGLNILKCAAAAMERQP